ncbi:UDP-N-acetylmuramoyl-L-alanyl-D-glutamate--2,6-diaminopimelate ligase [Oceanobacillus piezotolerans]|uniref:UDP-N-acetylmuramyl-tripeptide synthetase n=1 Tax=Oceanobacillus piezotolerans TaxID=2448030 RepID=A0A498DL94_9BACI|nr:UDP-N-acetylmuramoyl-L-alanyl-D-glutamate--2,6-diaminopimelate ligase [Oceanobacillus piezotolerans]RLL47810.1 UDP-N-acetylmuramoyl-L-alanyl-D-glutamate--2,6-diaminopimelate ligase [Oceanobacillus piezotolerans]
MLGSLILEGLKFEVLQGQLNQEINSVTYDSREVKNDSMFVAITGYTVDGHHFIESAIDAGASVIVCEKPFTSDKGVTVIKVDNSRKALARISSNFYGNPSENLKLIGITGTNGKTSTSYFVKSIFDQSNRPFALIGTIGTVINNELTKNDNTTPESLRLQSLFRQMVDADVDNCMMEVSSHALSLDRVSYTDFNIGIFTNLTPDHLELHKNMEEYFLAKAKLFKMTSDYNIINNEDYYGKKLVEMLEKEKANLITYGLDDSADIYATNLDYNFNYTSYTVNTPSEKIEVKVNFPGEIYVLNSLAAIACAYYSGFDLETIKKGIESVTNINGRFEVVYEEDDFKVIVDFAHTEDALQKLLSTVRPFVKGRIILVFGVYADLSKQGTEKRFGMARVAAEYADLSIITLDNPKNNNPETIMSETIESMNKNKGKYKALYNRQEAIEYAISESNKNDVVIIAGKGHERTQIIGDREIPFNEKEIVLHAMEEKKANAHSIK